MQKWRSLALHSTGRAQTPRYVPAPPLPPFCRLLTACGTAACRAAGVLDWQWNRLSSLAVSPSVLPSLQPSDWTITDNPLSTGNCLCSRPCLCWLEACSVSKLPKQALLSAASSLHIPSPCSACPQQVTQPTLLLPAVCRNCLLLWGDRGDLISLGWTTCS